MKKSIFILAILSTTALFSQRHGQELLDALRNRDLESAKRLYYAGANVNARDALGRTPLHYAAQHNAKWLKERFVMISGADPNVKWLAERFMIIGADPFARDKLGRRPIDSPMIQEIFENMLRERARMGTQFTR